LLTFVHSESIRSHTVKDRQFLRYKAKPDLVSKPDQKIGSTLSLEEHQPCIRLVRLSQNRQHNGVCRLVNRNFSDFHIVPGSARASRALDRTLAIESSIIGHHLSTSIVFLIKYFTFVAGG